MRSHAFRRLPRGIILLLSALLICAVAIHAMHTTGIKAGKEEQKAATMADSVRSRQRNLPLLQAHIDQSRMLQQRGLIGPEQRAAWADRLRMLGRLYAPSKLDYQLQAQQRLPEHPDFAYSAMQLHLQLLHEGDFLAVLDALEKTQSAYVRARKCTLQRMPVVGEALSPTLEAECVMEWITVPNGARI